MLTSPQLRQLIAGAIEEHLNVNHPSVQSRRSTRWLERNELARFDHHHSPGRFPEGQLRTVQRRIREWRHVMARALVHACQEGKGAAETPSVVGADENV